MSATIDIQLFPGALALIERFRAMPQEFPQAIKRGLQRSLEIVSGRIQEKRLTGHGPFPVAEHRLGEVTGTLRPSVRVSDVTVISQGDHATVEGGIGSPVIYAAVHEFGFTGDVNVKPFVRKNPRGDVLAKFDPGHGRSTRTTKKIASGVSNVKAHTRRMNIPERAPFRTGIEENFDFISAEIEKELVATLETK